MAFGVKNLRPAETEGDALFEVQVQTASDVRFGVPRRLFDVPENLSLSEVTRDGQRFVAVQREPRELKPVGLVVAANWLR